MHAYLQRFAITSVTDGMLVEKNIWKFVRQCVEDPVRPTCNHSCQAPRPGEHALSCPVLPYPLCTETSLHGKPREVQPPFIRNIAKLRHEPCVYHVLRKLFPGSSDGVHYHTQSTVQSCQLVGIDVRPSILWGGPSVQLVAYCCSDLRASNNSKKGTCSWTFVFGHPSTFEGGPSILMRNPGVVPACWTHPYPGEYAWMDV